MEAAGVIQKAGNKLRFWPLHTARLTLSIHFFPPHPLSFTRGAWGDWTTELRPRSLRLKVGWTSEQFITQRETNEPPHQHPCTFQGHQLSKCVWRVGGTWRTCRKPTQTQNMQGPRHLGGRRPDDPLAVRSRC